ncbi:SRPBCC domain-containing protein [Streptomyces sp. NPDC004042]|uniref:SRPBCC domain-containing protein n=1 Tax=Streptomyces sp. NPDC004042 TaxID=3154451 RepID=UPI0033BF82BE
MEHEVFVPVPARRLRAVLADPARVARAVPGLQQEAGAEPVAGRLKVRIGGHSITYRGTLRVRPRDDGGYAVEGEATESRGNGAVKIGLTLGLRDTDEGTALVFGGTASAGGRAAGLAPDAVRSAATRLLHRFAHNLAAGAAETARSLATEDFTPAATGDFEAGPDADDAPVPPPGPDAGEDMDTAAADRIDRTEPAGPSGHRSVFDTEVPPSSLDPLADDEGTENAENAENAEDTEDIKDADGTDVTDASDVTDDDIDDIDDIDDTDEDAAEDLGQDPGEGLEASGGAAAGGGTDQGLPAAGGGLSADDDLTSAGTPPAEAAHARRTMIGRSAEEVDHAPPRGRYAPVPAPLTVSANSTLRWAAPAAALVVAGAIVVGRALRRRR